MARGKPLTVVLVYKGEVVDTLPQEARDHISERLSKTISAYYTAHPDEYRAFCAAIDENRAEQGGQT